MTLEFSLREANPNDLSFVYDCWLNETRHAPISKHIPTKIYRPNQHKIIENIIKKSNILIACHSDPEKENQIFGLVVYEKSPLIIHWIYVKDLAYRKQGLARSMMENIIPSFGSLEQPQIVCSHSGKEIFQDRKLVEKYHLIFNPYILKGYL